MAVLRRKAPVIHHYHVSSFDVGSGTYLPRCGGADSDRVAAHWCDVNCPDCLALKPKEKSDVVPENAG
jgi:hypothetical protein